MYEVCDEADDECFLVISYFIIYIRENGRTVLLDHIFLEVFFFIFNFVFLLQFYYCSLDGLEGWFPPFVFRWDVHPGMFIQ